MGPPGPPLEARESRQLLPGHPAQEGSRRSPPHSRERRPRSETGHSDRGASAPPWCADRSAARHQGPWAPSIASFNPLPKTGSDR
eukprot:8488498-Heterocapsa_arctica.AAC.1